MLTRNHRLLDDSLNLECAHHLRDLREGRANRANWKFFMQDRRKETVLRQASQATKDKVEAATNIVPTHDLADLKNQDRLRRLNAGTCRILANGDLSAPPGKSKFRDERYQGLLAELNLAVGAKVMLRYNLSVARGLVNGSFGTVVGTL